MKRQTILNDEIEQIKVDKLTAEARMLFAEIIKNASTDKLIEYKNSLLSIAELLKDYPDTLNAMVAGQIRVVDKELDRFGLCRRCGGEIVYDKLECHYGTSPTGRMFIASKVRKMHCDRCGTKYQQEGVLL